MEILKSIKNGIDNAVVADLINSEAVNINTRHEDDSGNSSMNTSKEIIAAKLEYNNSLLLSIWYIWKWWKKKIKKQIFCEEEI